MSGLRRAFRHPDRVNDSHARARRLVSDEFLAPLAGPDKSWLAIHLDGCAICRQMAADWAGDRAALRSLGESAPVPPRNLGARLAAALDSEEARARRDGFARRASARHPGGSPSRLPAMTMVLVATVAAVALVILPVVAPFGGGPLTPGSPAATPIMVAAAPVTWARSDQEGRFVVQSAVVDRVCPGTETEACGTLDEGSRAVVTLDLQPSQVILPPTGDQGIAVGPTGIYTFVIPEQGERVTPGPPMSSQSPTNALPTPAATEVPTSPPVGTPAPSDSSLPIPTGPLPSTSASASPAPGSAAPGSPSATAPVPSAATLPPSTPAPVAATALAILDDIVLVGAAPAYSADGQWLAFSARPVSGERGPDVYVWRVGDERARRLTTTGASVFSGWLGDRILGSAVDVVGPSATTPEPGRTPEPDAGTPVSSAAPAGSPAAERTSSAVPSPESSSAAPSADGEGGQPAETPGPGESVAPGGTLAPSETPAGSAPPETAPATEPGASPAPSADASTSPSPSAEPSAAPGPQAVAFSFLLDPASTELETLPRPGIWRPVVDPSGTTVIYFTGRFAWSDDEQTWVPASGSLVVADWADVVDPERPLGSSALPGTAGHPGRMQTWNVRWAEGGDHLAVWLADEGSPSTGRLSLYATDEDGRPTEALLDAKAALPAFSIDARRLVWATPPGEGGEGSKVGVFAWGGTAPGAVYSAPQPREGIVVVR